MSEKQLLTEQEGIDLLKARMPRVEISISAAQVALKWGYCRTWRTLQFAVETGQAVYCDRGFKIKFKPV